MQPWFGNVYEFHLLSQYSFSRARQIDGLTSNLKSPYHVNLFYFDLDFTPNPEWTFDLDVQFAETTQREFNFRSFAAQGRYLWFDDLIGDPFSFSTGLSVRATPSYFLKDVSCPHHGLVDFEISASIGKEFELQSFWLWRLWAFGGMGQSNAGSPWVKAIVGLETNLYEKHKFALFLETNNGFGKYSNFSFNNFQGYGKTRYKFLDATFRYGYRIGPWGTIRVQIDQRIRSRACPKFHSFSISYLLPFSF